MPPPLPSPGNLIEIQDKWATEAPNYVFTRYFFSYTGTAPTIGACAAIATEWQALFVANAKNLLSSSFALVATTVTDLSSSSGSRGGVVATNAGGRGGTAPLAQTPVHVEFNLARRYRGGKPGAYFPFGDQGDWNNVYQWTSAFITAVDSDVSSWFLALPGFTASGTVINHHDNIGYFSGFTVVTNPLTGRARNVPKARTVPLVDAVIGYSAKTRISSQRRRRGDAN